jgi:Recombinase zinc beta ribbon domain
VANQERLRENARRYNEKTGPGRGAPREGAAFLQGLITCGRCGYWMSVAYRPRSCYTCTAMARRGAAARCVHLEGPPIEAFVVQAFFDAMAPAQLAALAEVLAQRQRDHQRLER